jgi:hypothetical protein
MGIVAATDFPDSVQQDHRLLDHYEPIHKAAGADNHEDDDPGYRDDDDQEIPAGAADLIG